VNSNDAALLAAWSAGRSGLGDDLSDPVSLRPVPAPAILDRLLAHVRDALEDTGDYAEVTQLRQALTERGNGASQQRASYARTGRLEDVVADSVRRTLG
jgi:carboxylate-amine ligase